MEACVRDWLKGWSLIFRTKDHFTAMMLPTHPERWVAQLWLLPGGGSVCSCFLAVLGWAALWESCSPSLSSRACCCKSSPFPYPNLSDTEKVPQALEEGSDHSSQEFRKAVWTTVCLIWTLKSALDLDMW